MTRKNREDLSTLLDNFVCYVNFIACGDFLDRQSQESVAGQIRRQNLCKVVRSKCICAGKSNRDNKGVQQIAQGLATRGKATFFKLAPTAQDVRASPPGDL